MKNTEAFVIEVSKDHLGEVEPAVKSLNGVITATDKLKRYVVTAADTSESADGKPKVLDVLKSKEEAKAFVRNEIESYADEAAGMDIIVDFDKMTAHTSDFNYGCEWNIEEIDIEL